MISLHLGSVSQTIDTICLPLSKAKEIIAAAEQKKVLERDIVTYKSDNQILLGRISAKDLRINEKDSIISDFKSKDTINNGIAKSFQQEILVLQSEKADYKKALKRQATKTKLSAFVGIALGVGVILLLK